MKNTVKLILSILTLLLLFLPMAQEHLKIFEFRELSGVMAEQEQPTMTFTHFTNHSLQQWVESHLKLNYGLKEPLTRIYNQYLWDFYHQSNVVKNKEIYFGDDGWIYEKPHVREFYSGRGSLYANDSAGVAKLFGEEALRLYQLQQILENQGTHLFVLLLPGKELIYPEHVPQTTDFPDKKFFSAREFYANRFKELGVNHIDVGQWFLEMKDTVDYPLFPQTGTHWSNYAVMHATDSIIRYMEKLGNIKMQHFTIGERVESTVSPDDDLEQLMNLARPLPKTPNYYATCTIIEDSTASKPTLITIGDSFYWNLLNATPFGKIMGGIRYWYYYNTVYYDSLHNNIKDVDVMREVLDADFLMLAYCTPQIYSMSQGFSQQLLLEICCDKEDIDAAHETLVKTIPKNQKWMEGLVKLAEHYDFTIDSVINEEARNCIMKYPNRFVPALMDSIPTKRSQKFMQYNGIQQ